MRSFIGCRRCFEQSAITARVHQASEQLRFRRSVAHALEESDRRVASIAGLDLDVRVQLVRQRQIAIDLERAQDRLLSAFEVGFTVRGATELPEQTVTAAKSRPCWCKTWVALDRAPVKVERSGPLRDIEL